MIRPRFGLTNFAWLCLAVFLTFIGYYVLEIALIATGELLMGSVGFFKTGLPDYRILLLPIAAIIVFRAFWPKIKPTVRRSD
jgi:hypothetical protein